jgi:hypothetical protein
VADNVEERLAKIQHEIERIQAYNEIQNLVAKDEVSHTPASMEQSYELFALKQPDVSVEIAMWGKIVGPENVKRMYVGTGEKREPQPGGMFEHQLTTPVIQVAKDGKTAKGLWFSCGHETYRGDFEPDPNSKLVGHWNYGKFGADFIKEDGEWKIWHYHWYDTFMAPYHISWVDGPQPPRDQVRAPEGMDVLPPTSRSTYYTDEVRRPIPEWPEPYDTWDGKSVA